MSQLFVYHTSQPIQAIKVLNHFEDISSTLAQIGVGFEQWQAQQPLTPESDAEQIIAAYDANIARLQQSAGYKNVDVIKVDDAHADALELRKQYLEEHSYPEDTVRCVVNGRLAFSLHIDEHIYVAVCAKGAAISIPAGIKQWSDMGERPHFTAIRLFNTTQALEPQLTGDTIAQHYPVLDDLL